jgi:hypothetical protein
MTLCIAAHCLDGDESKIVVCSDLLVTTQTASSNTQIKFNKFDSVNFGYAFAGHVPEATELVSLYESAVKTLLPGDTSEDLHEKLREPINLRKSRMIQFHVRKRLGMTYQEFIERGELIDTTLRADITRYINETNIEEELIIFGYHGKSPVIFKMEYEQVRISENFACIGIGHEAADQSLHRRQQMWSSSMERTLYHVYEAKRMGEIAPAVGPNTVMMVFALGDPDFKGWSVPQEGMAFLERTYRKYGPKPTTAFRVPSDVSLLRKI